MMRPLPRSPGPANSQRMAYRLRFLDDKALRYYDEGKINDGQIFASYERRIGERTVGAHGPDFGKMIKPSMQ